MNYRLKINPLKFLVFLLPASLLVLISLSAEWKWNVGIEWNLIVFVIAFVYPIVNAIVFVKSKILLWSAPAVYAVLIIISAVFMFKFWSSHTFWTFFIVELAAIVWSLVCSLIAFLVRRKTNR